MSHPRFGVFTSKMEALVTPHVREKVVWDLGTGDLWHARMLLRCGATSVVAVDKESPPRHRHPKIHVIQAPFIHVPLPDAIEVAYLSWPANYFLPGLVNILARSRVVIYVGSNMCGRACGDRTLFDHLISRSVLDHIPDEHNSLVVYGDRGETSRHLLPEELAALHNEHVWSLDEATQAVKDYDRMFGII